MQPLLKTTNLSTEDWMLCLGISLSLVVLVELRKLATRIYLRTKKDRVE